MRGLVFPLTIIGLFVFFAIFAELVAPYPYAMPPIKLPRKKLKTTKRPKGISGSI